MTTPHPHKDILIAIANGLPLSEVESRHITWANDTWEQLDDRYYYDILKYPHSWKLRIKTKTVTFNGMELPEPVTETPSDMDILYVPRPESPDNYVKFHWLNSEYDPLALKKGLIHKTKEAAIAWADAMTPFKAD